MAAQFLATGMSLDTVPPGSVSHSELFRKPAVYLEPAWYSPDICQAG
jgi:hypothetical protein